MKPTPFFKWIETRLTKEIFEDFIPSILIKQMLTKYFSSFDDFVYINSYTFKLVKPLQVQR